MRSLIDPLDSIRYTEDRNCIQAADFLQLLGFSVSPNALEQLHDRDAKSFPLDRTGKISDQNLERLIKKPKPWLTATPRPKMDSGMMTVREALEQFPNLQVQQIRRVLAAGANYFLKSDGNERYLAIPESWFRAAAGLPTSELPPTGGIVGKMAPAKPTPATSSAPVPKPVQAASPKRAKPAAATPIPKVSEDALVEAAPPASLQITTGDEEGVELVSTKMAVEFLQTDGYDIVYNDLYSAGHSKPPKINLVRKDGKRYLYISIKDLDELLENPPAWLTDHPRKYPAIEGYKMTRDVQQEFGVVPSRLYEAISAGLVKRKNLALGKNQGALYYISNAEVERMLAENLLCRFLRGEKVTIPEIEAYRQEHADTLEHHQNHQVPVPEAPNGAVVVDFEPTPANDEPETQQAPQAETLGMTELLTKVHHARLLVSTYDVGIRDRWTDEEFLDILGELLS